jgi:hypothetical protein
MDGWLKGERNGSHKVPASDCKPQEVGTNGSHKEARDAVHHNSSNVQTAKVG